MVGVDIEGDDLMTNYSNNPGSVRVDYFKPRGKWYETLEVDMRGFYTGQIHDCVRGAVMKSYPDFNFDSWIVVCLEPYHEHSHPVMFKPE